MKWSSFQFDAVQGVRYYEETGWQERFHTQGAKCLKPCVDSRLKLDSRSTNVHSDRFGQVFKPLRVNYSVRHRPYCEIMSLHTSLTHRDTISHKWLLTHPYVTFITQTLSVLALALKATLELLPTDVTNRSICCEPWQPIYVIIQCMLLIQHS